MILVSYYLLGGMGKPPHSCSECPGASQVKVQVVGEEEADTWMSWRMSEVNLLEYACHAMVIGD